MTRKYRNYTDEDIIKFSSESTSIAQLLVKLDLRPIGGNYANIKKHIQRLEIDTAHWTGQGWSKDKQLKNWSDYARVEHLKPHLILKRGHKCQCCELVEWQNNLIPLEVHHKNGNRTDNSEENLSLMCPNCHALTENWRGRK